MRDLVICECCGTTFETSSNHEVCSACLNTGPQTRCVDNETTSLRKKAKSLGAKSLTDSANKEFKMTISHNYNDQDLLMNIETGSVDTVENWIAGSSEWFTDEVSAQDQFDNLQLVSE